MPKHICKCSGCKQRAAWRTHRERVEKNNTLIARVVRGVVSRLFRR